uniref:Cytochrome b6-f complex subunit 7 n=2 Tax=Laurencia TaxID=99900 RepID=A0AA51NEI8_9FLOR|nr:Cytochrome b6-f complex subunit 7 [Laurencia catarinensis]WMP11860.1 Cytochrome b6-f complex subunit 7 [Laurencia australis]WMP12071.1 Cytochrome b6-f complex subunit 7 [Laurencia australis]WMP12494.1 Cytochrome b6-f complex subunit 7 [Laurencia catarinensis]CRF40140.1 Cytochrome b6-f complex subunit 7 [Laurencia snackeyi]
MLSEILSTALISSFMIIIGLALGFVLLKIQGD